MVSYMSQFKHKNNNNNKKLHLTVQKGAGWCMYPFDVISSVAWKCSQINDWFIPILGCSLKPASNFSIAYTICKKSAKIWWCAFKVLWYSTNIECFSKITNMGTINKWIHKWIHPRIYYVKSSIKLIHQQSHHQNGLCRHRPLLFC